MAGSTADRKVLAAAEALSRECAGMRFAAPVAVVYDPLEYAREGYAAYVSRYGSGAKEVVLVGMNPGPFGMAQTGVPFGHVGLVRDWMGIEVAIGKPSREHPKRPIDGFACTRSEVSGARLWGWARDRFDTPQRFFSRFFVLNYCPLAFMEESGRNLTPDKLPAGERAVLFGACDRALGECLDALKPRHVVGVGRFAADRVAPLAAARGMASGVIPHPSPASPTANRGWSAAAERALADQGVVVA